MTMYRCFSCNKPVNTTSSSLCSDCYFLSFSHCQQCRQICKMYRHPFCHGCYYSLLPVPKKKKSKSRISFNGADQIYQSDEIQFMQDMNKLVQRIQRIHHRYPDWADVLQEAIRLGFRLVASPDHLFQPNIPK